MVKGIASRFTYANGMATVAVFIALGGSAYAAFAVPKNSVGTKQLKNGAVTTMKLHNGAVTAAKVANHSLTIAYAKVEDDTTDPVSSSNPDLGAHVNFTSVSRESGVTGGYCLHPTVNVRAVNAVVGSPDAYGNAPYIVRPNSSLGSHCPSADLEVQVLPAGTSTALPSQIGFDVLIP